MFDWQCTHEGMTFETLHWKYFVKCEICKKWRLRRKRDVFWKFMPMYFGGVENKQVKIKLSSPVSTGYEEKINDRA